jgi:hypothetical protein
MRLNGVASELARAPIARTGDKAADAMIAKRQPDIGRSLSADRRSNVKTDFRGSDCCRPTDRECIRLDAALDLFPRHRRCDRESFWSVAVIVHYRTAPAT